MILTPDQRLRVFLSSTLGELAAERAAARTAIEQLRLIPVMFELGARPHPPRALYRSYLAQSHVFVGIYGDRYGWVAPDETISGLEDEYRLAGGLPRILYVREPGHEREPRLRELLADISEDEGAVHRRYATPEELGGLLLDDLATLLAGRFSATARPVADPDVRSETPMEGHGAGLPVATTPLIGRDDELRALAALLLREDVRILTLSGVGGIGKSRLALEVAHRVSDHFPGGVHLVTLAPLPSGDAVLPAVARGLDVQLEGGGGVVAALAEALADRGSVLLVLDNAEHVIEAAPDIAELVAACPELTLLVTSRRLLRIAGEHDHPVPPLAAPPTRDAPGRPGPVLSAEADLSRWSATELFLARAREVRPDLVLTPADVLAVGELAWRLDGIPLAIELAAARSRLLPPAALLARLERTLDLQGATIADLPERQRTLRATLDWSHDLLTPSERSLLAQLSTFHGGASLAAIEAVCDVDDLLDSLAALTEHSLVQVDAAALDAPRFSLLQAVREYGRERLHEAGQLAAVDARHEDWVLALSARARTALTGPDSEVWCARLDLEGSNIQAAAGRALARGDGSVVVQIAYDTWIWVWGHHHIDLARRALLRAQRHQGGLAPQLRAALDCLLAGAAFEQGDFEACRQLVRAAARQLEEVGDVRGRALARFIEGSLAPLYNEHARAIEELERAADDFASQGDAYTGAFVECTLGMMLANAGQHEAGEERFQRSLMLSASIGDRRVRGQAHAFRGFALLLQGRIEDARRAFGHAAAFEARVANPETLAYACDGLAAVRLGTGDPTGAAELAGVAATVRSRVGVAVWPEMRPGLELLADLLRAQLGEEAYETARSRGYAVDLETARGLVAATAGPLTVPDGTTPTAAAVPDETTPTAAAVPDGTTPTAAAVPPAARSGT